MTKAAGMLAGLMMLAAPMAAQTTNDDTTATENWWDKVGAEFFSDATLDMPRPEHEIRAQWTGLSADDQAAVRARCAAREGQGNTAARSLDEGDEDNAPGATAGDLADLPQADVEAHGDGATHGTADAEANTTTTTGSIKGQEQQVPSAKPRPAPYTGLAGGLQEAPNMIRICDLIDTL